MSKKIVVTGIGASSPIGGTARETWDALLAGVSGAKTLEYDWVEKYDLPVQFAAEAKVEKVAPSRVFLQALMVNLLNPKVILFILAFLPQFVDPARAILPQFLTLGVVFSFGGLIVNGAVGLFAGSIGQRVAKSANLSRWLSRISATIFGALALRLALMPRS